VSFLTITEAITQYQNGFLAARNLAPLTRVNYLQRVRYLTEQMKLERIDQVRPPHLDGFPITLDQRGLRGSSRRRKVAIIGSLFHFLVQQGIQPASPADEILPPERECVEEAARIHSIS
jgi:site-specific recombinase XerC